MKSPVFTVNIQNGGALLPDARRLVELWDLAESADSNLRRVADVNLLGKATRRRLDDVLLRCLAARFVSPGTHVIAALKDLLGDQRAFIEAVYYETSRDEALLAAFVEGPCFDWYEAGRARVTIDDRLWPRARRADGAARSHASSAARRRQGPHPQAGAGLLD